MVTIQSFVVAVLKVIIQQPRPRSCLSNCGMPSGHSSFAGGMFVVFVWHLVLHPEDPTERLQCSCEAHAAAPARGPVLKLLLICLLMIPVPWSRIYLGDHSGAQCAIGASIGAGLGILWVTLLADRVEAMLGRWRLPFQRRQATDGAVLTESQSLDSSEAPAVEPSMLNGPSLSSSNRHLGEKDGRV
eukprot:TRINITY_DN62598_c0_g1_i2.p1 TRINITY_DN62598_c0_g1~~TRINITY_DN62598_c0_g1_i2.p1  ORF type:complete len:187 (+),score=11.38 TRINITY_DN62598_c0_g1_i2:282-842(+)